MNMKQLPESERPYEKFRKFGPEALSDADLLAIILKTGTRNQSSMELARKILCGYHNNLLNLYELSLDQLMTFDGIGEVKAIQLKAVAELSKRISATRSGYSMNMDHASSIADYYMERLRHLEEEQLYCAYFNSKCHFIGDDRLTIGNVNSTMVSPRELFVKALRHGAVMLVLLHNHPSGDPAPSNEDLQTTILVADCGRMLGVELVDHIIIGDGCYYSFAEEGLISRD